MLKPEKVNEIWDVLFQSVERMSEAFGSEFKTMGEMVDFVTGDAMTHGAWTREEVLEAWLYYQLQLQAKAAGVPYRPRS